MSHPITIVLTILLLTLTACDSTTCPPQSQGPDGPPWELPDSAYKVLENLEHAYNTLDLELYMSCFREDFEFHLLEVTWPPEFWGYDTEEAIHDSMFGSVYGNELDLWGSAAWPWSGDSSGASWELQRSCSLGVMITEWEGFRAEGVQIFICRPDTNGTWFVWKWFDNSELKAPMTWGDIKLQFL